jgi:hypothetical protein
VVDETARAIIRDTYDGSILVAIDVSGLGKTFSPHCLALAVTTAGRIESQLARQEMDFRYHLLECSMAKMSSGHDGVIICDRRVYPIKANERAASMLISKVPSRSASLNLGNFFIDTKCNGSGMAARRLAGCGPRRRRAHRYLTDDTGAAIEVIAAARQKGRRSLGRQGFQRNNR